MSKEWAGVTVAMCLGSFHRNNPCLSSKRCYKSGICPNKDTELKLVPDADLGTFKSIYNMSAKTKAKLEQQKSNTFWAQQQFCRNS